MNVSVVIPTYNRSALLKRALESLYNQTDKDFEVIIYNDAGVDDTDTVVAQFKLKFPKCTYIIGEKNMGVNVARNRAVLNCNNDVIAFLDDDDEFIPEAIYQIKNIFSTLPTNINVAYFNSIIERDNDSYVGGFQFDNSKEFYDPSYKETMIKYNLKGDCKPVFRKKIFLDHKYKFPESVNGFESYLMNLIARDNKGIRYFKNITTRVHFKNEVSHLSHTGPRKKPWPLFMIHFKQISEHVNFYIKNPVYLLYKIITMAKLFVRSIIVFFINFKSKTIDL